MTPPIAPRGAEWTVQQDDDAWFLCDFNGDDICWTGLGPDAESEAKHLALVLNAHAPLVEALAGLLTWAEADRGEKFVATHDPDCGCAAPISLARAALLLARGETEP